MQSMSSGCWKQLPTLLWKTRKGEVKTMESPLKELVGSLLAGQRMER
jgi:hypothetical protein